MSRVGKKQYQIVGKLLFRHNPSYAQELLSYSKASPIPAETDLTKIPLFFTKFCTQRNISPEDYRGAILNRNKTATRKLFVACMLHLYNPQLFEDKTQEPMRGIVRALSTELGMKESNVSTMIREIVGWVELYEDFRAQVEDTRNKLLRL